MRCTLVVAGTCLLVSAALTAADFWQEKDFTLWSVQQVQKMLTDSPWARKVTLVTGSIREEEPGGFQGGGAGIGGGGGAPRSSDGGNAEIQGVRRVTVTVAWISALPIRQALLRQQPTGTRPGIVPGEPSQLPEDEPFYAVAVSGLPMRLAAKGSIDEVENRTMLKPNRKEPIRPEDIRISQDGAQTVRVEFRFPRTSAIAPDDKEVEFTTKMGDVELARKFRLGDMMVRGRLAL